MIKRIAQRFRALHEDTSGAMSVEKVMIIALIALPIVIALYAFRKILVKWFQGQTNDLSPAE